MKNIYLQIADLPSGNTPVVLATIIATAGSTPQKSGSSALFDAAGLVSGTIGGGILEARVEAIAKTATSIHESGLYSFMLDRDISENEEAICGGQAEVMLDASITSHIPVFKKIKESLQKRKPGILVTRVTAPSDSPVSIERFWLAQGERYNGSAGHPRHLEATIQKIFAEGRKADYQELAMPTGDKVNRYFLEPVFPLPILVIAGAGHIGKVVAHLGNLLEFEVVVVDERGEFASRENIPDADHIVVRDIGQAIQSMQITPETYIVIVTRGHKKDADALKACIGSKAAYIGMIGSATKISLMRDKFISEGMATSGQWDSIYAPIGVDIHSKTVQEIAVSIAAQLVRIRNQKSTAHV